MVPSENKRTTCCFHPHPLIVETIGIRGGYSQFGVTTKLGSLNLGDYGDERREDHYPEGLEYGQI